MVAKLNPMAVFLGSFSVYSRTRFQDNSKTKGINYRFE